MNDRVPEFYWTRQRGKIRTLKVRRRVRFDVADHMEVIMVDVDDLDDFAIIQRVRNRITNDRPLAAINRALVVSVMQLRWADQRIKPRWIDVVGDPFLDDANVVALTLEQEWHAALNGTSLF